jgi:hypothetical protein
MAAVSLESEKERTSVEALALVFQPGTRFARRKARRLWAILLLLATAALFVNYDANADANGALRSCRARLSASPTSQPFPGAKEPATRLIYFARNSGAD